MIHHSHRPPQDRLDKDKEDEDEDEDEDKDEVEDEDDKDRLDNKFPFYRVFLAVTWQLYRFPCHWLTDSLTDSLTHWLPVLKKHYQRALWEACDPWDMWPEW